MNASRPCGEERRADARCEPVSAGPGTGRDCRNDGRKGPSLQQELSLFHCLVAVDAVCCEPLSSFTFPANAANAGKKCNLQGSSFDAKRRKLQKFYVF